MGAAADVEFGVQHRFHLRLAHAESAGSGKTRQQVALLALLHAAGRFHGALTDHLVQRLAVTAPLHGLHHEVFSGDKGEVLPHGAVHDLFVDVQAVGDVPGKAQNGIGAQEPLRHGDAAVGGVVQRALHPLYTGRHGGVHGVGHQVAAQRANALAAHGVALVGHGGGTDLVLLKRLLNLTVVLEKADVIGHAVKALGDGGEDIQNTAVHLAGVGLATDAAAAFKAERCAELAVELRDLLLIALEQLHKACLGAGGAPGAAELHGADDKVQLLQVKEQVLEPQRCPLANGDQLGGLIVGIAQGGGCLIFLREFGEVAHHCQQLTPQVLQSLAVEDEVGIVCHIAAGGAQVNDAGGGGGRLAVGVNMGHNVMAHFLFPLGGKVKVDVGNVGFQLRHLPGGDG